MEMDGIKRLPIFSCKKKEHTFFYDDEFNIRASPGRGFLFVFSFMTRALAYDTKGWFFFFEKKNINGWDDDDDDGGNGNDKKKRSTVWWTNGGEGPPPLVKRGGS